MDIRNLKINNILYNIATTWGKIKGDISDQTDLKNALDEKQNTLVSGTNIKTINSESILGTGNIDTSENLKTINNESIKGTGDISLQVPLVSGTNIKTINNNSILGSGNIDIQGGISSIKTINSETLEGTGNIDLQVPLVSGTNIKTVNNNSLLGSGNIDILETVLSTTKHAVGKDVNNNTIYEKSFEQSVTAGGMEIFNIGDTVSQLYAITGSVRSNQGGTILDLPIPYSNDNQRVGAFVYNQTQIAIHSNWTGTAYINLYYR